MGFMEFSRFLQFFFFKKDQVKSILEKCPFLIRILSHINLPILLRKVVFLEKVRT